MDMAVGVIVGGAFTAIVTSLNQDILTPILAIFGGTDFSNLYVKLGNGDTAPVLMYGNFITAVINFLITAFVIFCLVKFINKLGDTLHHKEEAPAEPLDDCLFNRADGIFLIITQAQLTHARVIGKPLILFLRFAAEHFQQLFRAVPLG